MRVALCLIALFALAGCASEEVPDDVAPAPVTEGNLTVPQPLHWAGSLKAAADPITGTTTGCELEQGCATHTFDIDQNLSVEIVLKSIDGTVTGVTAQALYGADYDLRLLDASGRELGTSTNPDVEDDVITIALGPGSYVIEVMAWNDQDGSYDLTVTFS